jgi:glycerol-3-phosphate acyltransferase PlsY
MAIIFRYSSLAALTASVLAPLYIGLFTGSIAYVVSISAMSLLLIVRHRSNIRKLFAGTENRIGQKKPA